MGTYKNIFTTTFDIAVRPKLYFFKTGIKTTKRGKGICSCFFLLHLSVVDNFARRQGDPPPTSCPLALGPTALGIHTHSHMSKGLPASLLPSRHENNSQLLKNTAVPAFPCTGYLWVLSSSTCPIHSNPSWLLLVLWSAPNTMSLTAIPRGTAQK